MQTIFTAAELKENYQILLRLLGQLQTENDYLQAAMDNLSKIPNCRKIGRKPIRSY